MAEISKLNLTGSDLDIKDSVARQKLTVVDPSAGEGLITFGVDSNGNYGYKKVGADTVIPFKSGDDEKKYFEFLVGAKGSGDGLTSCGLVIDKYSFVITPNSMNDINIVVRDYDNTVLENGLISLSELSNKIQSYVSFIANYFNITVEFNYINNISVFIKTNKQLTVYNLTDVRNNVPFHSISVNANVYITNRNFTTQVNKTGVQASSSVQVAINHVIM